MDLIHQLTEEKINLLFSSINYSEEQLQLDLVHIKEWLKQQEHLPPARLTETEEFLQFFLTGCKGNVDKVKQKLDAYYTYRSKSVLFQKRDPLAAKYKFITEMSDYAIMPHTTKDGHRIAYGGLKHSDATNVDCTYVLRKLCNLTELSLRMEKYHAGFIIIINVQHNITIWHCLKIKLQLLKDVIQLFQEVLPFRLKAVFVLNTPYILELVINRLLLPFVNNKMKKRLLVTSKGIETLAEYLDVNLLSEDLGGKEESIKILNDKWMQKEIQGREWYMNELSQQNDETKRKVENNNQTMGYFTNIKTYIGSIVSRNEEEEKNEQ